jgi:hypothetical protein
MVGNLCCVIDVRNFHYIFIINDWISELPAVPIETIVDVICKHEKTKLQEGISMNYFALCIFNLVLIKVIKLNILEIIVKEMKNVILLLKINVYLTNVTEFANLK